MQYWGTTLPAAGKLPLHFFYFQLPSGLSRSRPEVPYGSTIYNAFAVLSARKTRQSRFLSQIAKRQNTGMHTPAEVYLNIDATFKI